MTNNLSRVTAKIFAGNAPLDTIGQFGSALAGTKVNTQDVAQIQALPAYEDGWSEAVISDRNYPTLEEFNGAMKVMSYQTKYDLDIGMPEWDANTVYYTNFFCQVNGVIYKSLIDENIGNNPTESPASWEEFIGGGSGAYLGQWIFSKTPLVEDTLHEIDGAFIPEGGVYDEFINNYIKNAHETDSNAFTTEEVWQEAVAQTGICDKYVYTEGVGVRLPKVGNKAYTTAPNQYVPASGNGKTLGYTNGTDNFGFSGNTSNLNVYLYNSAYGTDVGITPSGAANTTAKTIGVTTDPENSGIIAHTSDVLTPVEGYWYIVVATGAKTEIEVDLDNVTTDLNNKADKDFLNITDGAKALIAHNAMPSNTSIELAIPASNSTVVSPADGWFFIQRASGATTAAQTLLIKNNNTGMVTSGHVNQSTAAIYLYIPVKKGDTVMIYYTTTGESKYDDFRFIYAVGSESEAN